MLSLFLQIFLTVSYSRDIRITQLDWKEAGCTSEGLLSPSNVPYFWRTVHDQKGFVKNLREQVELGDGMATLSCRGETPSSYTDAYANTFHLMWECRDSGDCELPPVHSLCVRTLRALHPDSEIKLWSSTLQSSGLEELNINVHKYSSPFFAGLPKAAQEAARDMRGYMQRGEQDVLSHWSDLFRAAVLYKEGGIYTDLDSIWLRPITQALEAEAWIPRTPAPDTEDPADVVLMDGKPYFLEGGIMRFDSPHSPFLWHVLETFPKYDEEMANCWACVGPRQLVRAYNSLADAEARPWLIDSGQVFGVRNYRRFFKQMFTDFDPVIWKELSQTDVVAAHLFTATTQDRISKDSIIFHLLRVGGVNQLSETSASWRTQTIERRNLLSSLYYANIDGSALPGSAIISEDGSQPTYWYGNYETVTATVQLADGVYNPFSILDEVRSIYYSAFDVPQSAVEVSWTDGVGSPIAVKVGMVQTSVAESMASAAAQAVAASSAIPDGSSVTDVVLPEAGQTTLEIVMKGAVSSKDKYDEMMSVACPYGDGTRDQTTNYEESFEIKGTFSCSCNSGVAEDDCTEGKKAWLQGHYGVQNVMLGSEGAFTFETESIEAAIQHAENIPSNNGDITIDGTAIHCHLDVDNIMLHLSVTDSVSSTTHAEMWLHEQECITKFVESGFTVSSSVITDNGQQLLTSCQIFEECQQDYAELIPRMQPFTASLGYPSLSGEPDSLSWWWKYQLRRYINTNFDIDDVKVQDEFFMVNVTGSWINTCVLHSPQWTDFCDKTRGVCAGGVFAGSDNYYGFSLQQATALNAALENGASHVHPDCPWGCHTIPTSHKEGLQGTDILQADTLKDLCVFENRYLYWHGDGQVADTCVAYHQTASEQCAPSDYHVCPGVDDEKGEIIYGDFEAQAQALKVALEQDNYRHPQCSKRYNWE